MSDFLSLKHFQRMVESKQWFEVPTFGEDGIIPPHWSKGFGVVLGSLCASLPKTWSQVLALSIYEEVPQEVLFAGLVSQDDKVRAIAWDKLYLNGDRGVPEETYRKGFTDPLDCVRGAAIATYTHLGWKLLPKDVLAQGLEDKNPRIRGVCLEEWVSKKDWHSLDQIKQSVGKESSGIQTHFLFGLARNRQVVENEEWLHWLWNQPVKENKAEVRMYALMNEALRFTPSFLGRDFKLDHLLSKKGNTYLDMWVSHPNFNPTEEQIKKLIAFNENETYPHRHWERVFLTKKTADARRSTSKKSPQAL